VRVELDPPDAEALPAVLEAIRDADVITLGPGSLYTSLVASILPRGIVDALEASDARKIYIQNIMTQSAETSGLSMADHLEALAAHGLRGLFPDALVNTGLPSPAILREYEKEQARMVAVDTERVRAMGVRVIERDLLTEDGAIRHDPDALAEAVLGS